MSNPGLIIKERATPLRNHRHGLTQIACHPSEPLMAVADVDMLCEVWREGEILAWFDARTLDPKARAIQRVRNLFFSPDGSRLFVVAGERLMSLNHASQQVDWQYTAPRSWGFLVTSPTDAGLAGNDRLAASFDNGTIVVLDLEGRLVRRWKDEEAPRAMQFDGEKLIGTDTFRLLAWNLNGRRLMRAPLPQRKLSMQLAPNEPLAAMRSLESVLLVDTRDGEVVAQIPVGTGLPKLRFHPTDRCLAIVEKHAVVIVDYRGRFIARFEVPDAVVLSLTFSPAGERLLIGCSDRSLREFDLLVASGTARF